MSGPACDVLVVGHGAAGSVSARELARRGHDVTVAGRGTPSTALSTSRMSLSGVAGRKDVARVMMEMGRPHGLYCGTPGRRKGISNIGTEAGQDLSSPHDWCGEEEGSTAVLGLRGDPDLDPDLVCRVIGGRRPGELIHPYWADPRLPCIIDAGGGPRISEEAMVAVELLAGAISELGEDTVVLPPLFVGPSYARALSALEIAAGRAVREPATPLSNPGTRLQSCLEREMVSRGARLLRDRRLVRVRFEGGTALSATIASGMREIEIGFKALVLAPGNVVGGGLQVVGREVRETILGAAIDRRIHQSLRSPDLTAALAAGIRTEEGRAVLGDGTVLRNVWVAGSALPGNSYPLGRGLGSVVSTALAVAEMVGEKL